MEDKKQIIDKIRKIMALAENNPNENEAIAAALKAQKLMAKFHIEEKELGEELTESKIDSLRCTLNGKTQKWRLQLALVVAKNFRCKVYLNYGILYFMVMKKILRFVLKYFIPYIRLVLNYLIN